MINRRLDRRLLWIGCSLFGIGFLITLFLLKYFLTNQPSFSVFMLLPFPFLIAGSIIAMIPLRRKWKVYQIRKKGTKYPAKIFQYIRDLSVKINGEPQVHLKVRFFKDRVREVVVPAGFPNGEQLAYPLGMTVDIFEYHGKFTWDRNSLRKEVLPQEEALMKEELRHSTQIISILCHECHSIYQGVPNEENRCPICGAYYDRCSEDSSNWYK